MITDRTEIIEDEIYVYATTDDVDAVMANFVPTIGRDDATYELAKLDDPELDGAFTLTMRAGNREHTYRAWTYVDWQGLEVTGIETNDVVMEGTYWYENGIDVYAATDDIDMVMEYFRPTIGRDDATYTFTKANPEDSEDFTLKLSADGIERSYKCWVTVDWQGLEVTGVEINDVVIDDSYVEIQDIYVYAISSDLDVALDNIKPIIDRDDATYEIVKGDDGNVYLDISYGVITRRYQVHTYLVEHDLDD